MEETYEEEQFEEEIEESPEKKPMLSMVLKPVARSEALGDRYQLSMGHNDKYLEEEEEDDDPIINEYRKLKQRHELEESQRKEEADFYNQFDDEPMPIENTDTKQRSSLALSGGPSPPSKHFQD